MERLAEETKSPEASKKLAFRVKIISGIVCASLITSILISGNSISQQAHAHISDFFQNVMQIILRKPADDPGAALTIPPPAFEMDDQNNGPPKPEKVSLEGAQNKLAFSLLLPSYTPDNLTLENIRIFQGTDGPFRAAYLEYIDPTGLLVKVSERLITDNSSIITEIPAGIGRSKDITIDKHPGVLLEAPDGTIFVEWIVLDVKMLISGPLTEATALAWAASFQP
ncbi:hypothetical protein [Paenibacillus chungangensis]|uniref:DUF4367 domain-containing protein n=1 Tax=Paenibacillus chungangensis TaxID=696535 RepID=A0ABW3HWL8_9BACL